MTLEQWSYVADIVGVILVVGAPVHLARQVSQNNLMLRASAASERVQRDFDLSSAQVTRSPATRAAESHRLRSPVSER
jgi:hypothetical protein